MIISDAKYQQLKLSGNGSLRCTQDGVAERQRRPGRHRLGQSARPGRNIRPHRSRRKRNLRTSVQGTAHEDRTVGRDKGDERQRGRGRGDKTRDQRPEEVLAPQEHRDVLRRLHQEEPRRQGRPAVARHGVLRGGLDHGTREGDEGKLAEGGVDRVHKSRDPARTVSPTREQGDPP